jgi:hypothetical protein
MILNDFKSNLINYSNKKKILINLEKDIWVKVLKPFCKENNIFCERIETRGVGTGIPDVHLYLDTDVFVELKLSRKGKITIRDSQILWKKLYPGVSCYLCGEKGTNKLEFRDS